MSGDPLLDFVTARSPELLDLGAALRSGVGEIARQEPALRDALLDRLIGRERVLTGALAGAMARCTEGSR